MANGSLYDPPRDLEGENQGLVEAVAERLWSRRTRHMGHGQTFSGQSVAVKSAWREAADDILSMMFDIGFVGPAGPPRHDRFDGRSYAWHADAGQWEIIDEHGGFVALVGDHTDLELLLAAPLMRGAITALVGAIGPDHPARQMPEIIALAASLPDARNDQPRES